eukprot:6179248-Pleurochrysis_carterae.AAC.1
MMSKAQANVRPWILTGEALRTSIPFGRAGQCLCMDTPIAGCCALLSVCIATQQHQQSAIPYLL